MLLHRENQYQGDAPIAFLTIVQGLIWDAMILQRQVPKIMTLDFVL